MSNINPDQPIPARPRHVGAGAPTATSGEAARPTPTFRVQALLDDFPIEVEFSGTAEQLQATVRRLRELGAVPPTPQGRATAMVEKQREAPICQYHGPMKESGKAPGTWFCPQKMGDGTYCKSKG